MNFNIGDCTLSVQKQKIFCFGNKFSYMENAYVRELAGTRDMGQGM